LVFKPNRLLASVVYGLRELRLLFGAFLFLRILAFRVLAHGDAIHRRIFIPVFAVVELEVARFVATSEATARVFALVGLAFV